MKAEQRINYDKKMELLIAKEQENGHIPRLLLHSCCAPCSSAVLERLSAYFEITILYYNPNIEPEEEYRKRVAELDKLLHKMPLVHPVNLIDGRYDPSEFYEAVKGREQSGEGGSRCYECYKLRLAEAACYANEGAFDYFTTTLSISPYKNVAWLNEIGETYAREYGISYLYSDFKKKEGYRRSIALSKEYGLYRQDYCGCSFSRQEREKIKQQKREENREI